jgi:hypothetical protein
MSIDLHAVSDLRTPITSATAKAVLSWPGGHRSWRFNGDIPADSCTLIGRLSHVVESEARPGDLRLVLTLRWADGQTTNSYSSRID